MPTRPELSDQCGAPTAEMNTALEFVLSLQWPGINADVSHVVRLDIQQLDVPTRSQGIEGHPIVKVVQHILSRTK